MKNLLGCSLAKTDPRRNKKNSKGKKKKNEVNRDRLKIKSPKTNARAQEYQTTGEKGCMLYTRVQMDQSLTVENMCAVTVEGMINTGMTGVIERGSLPERYTHILAFPKDIR